MRNRDEFLPPTFVSRLNIHPANDPCAGLIIGFARSRRSAESMRRIG